MTSEAGTSPIPENFIGQVFKGMMYPIQALGFLRRHNLWGMATASILINILLLVVLVGGAFYYLVPSLGTLSAGMVAWAGDSSFWGYLIGALSWVLWIVAFPAIIVANFLVLVLVGQAVASPFLDTLSEQVENRVLGSVPEPFGVGRAIKTVIVALGDLFWGVVFLVIVNGPLLVLGLVPVLGTGVAAVISFGFSALLLAHEFMGLPLTRQLVSYRQRWSHVWRHKWLALGMGASTMLLLAIPGINLVLLPLAAVGGTLMYCDLRSAGRV